MKTTNILFALALLLSTVAFAQVGIGNTDPKATLDVTADATTATVADGIIAPRITKANLAAKSDGTYGPEQEGTIIYVTNLVSIATNPETINVTAVGYYYFTGTVWQPFTPAAAGKFVDGTTATDAVYTGGNVGIGTTDPKGALDIVSTTQGFAPPRMTELQMNAITGIDLFDGLIVFCIDCDTTGCLNVYSNSAWNCLGAPATTTVTNNCDQNGFAGSYVNGVPLSGATFSVTVTNGSFSTTTIAFASTDVILSGAAQGDITVGTPTGAPNALTAGGDATLAAGGSVTVTYPLTGTPGATGTLQADWTKLSLTCTKTTTVTNGDATFNLPQTQNVVSLYDAGPPIVSLQGVVDNDASASGHQITFTVPYTGGAGSYDAYDTSSTPITVTGQGADVNTLSIGYPSGTFAASGTGTITVTVTVAGADTSFNVAQQAIGVITTFATLDFQVNGTSKGNLLIDALGGIPDRNFADANHKFVYLPVTNPATGETWLNNNLGAAYSNTNDAVNFSPTTQAASSTDFNAYGSLFQWGRQADGHEIIQWATPTTSDGAEQFNERSTTSLTPTVDSGEFIVNGNGRFYTGTTPSFNDLWLEDGTGVNNPCPIGYRIATDIEFNTERLSWSTSNAAGAASGVVKFTVPGYRVANTGNLTQQGNNSFYWSSNSGNSNTNAYSLSITPSGAAIFNDGNSSTNASFGMPIRCIKE